MRFNALVSGRSDHICHRMRVTKTLMRAVNSLFRILRVVNLVVVCASINKIPAFDTRLRAHPQEGNQCFCRLLSDS